ncbi:MAG: VWA domain-containing protein, partial [Elusimicrobiota bacterium]
VAGDDIRSMDWNVTARCSRPFVKQFIEERELTLMILCDVSASQSFGSAGKPKSEAAAELAAMFAFSALKNSDKSGLLLFSDKTELYIPPRKGKNHSLRIIRELLAYAPKNRGTDIALALKTANSVMKRRGIIILISDFNAPDYASEARLTAQRHDLIPVVITDRFERALPEARALLVTEQLEGGESFTADLSSPAYRAAYETAAAGRRADMEAVLRSAGSDWIDIDPALPVHGPVVKFFRQRKKNFKLL